MTMDAASTQIAVVDFHCHFHCLEIKEIAVCRLQVDRDTIAVFWRKVLSEMPGLTVHDPQSATVFILWCNTLKDSQPFTMSSECL